MLLDSTPFNNMSLVLHEPDPAIFHPLEERREFLLDNGKRVMLLSRETNTSHDNTLIHYGDDVFMIVRELFGLEKSPALRPAHLNTHHRRQSGGSAGTLSPAHQDPQLSPPIPIIELSSAYIQAAQSNDSTASNNTQRSLARRDGPELCASGQPCPDGRYVIVCHTFLSLIPTINCAAKSFTLHHCSRANVNKLLLWKRDMRLWTRLLWERLHVKL